jgi:hypothetical protein
MAELTNVESKIGEVTGLAMASQVATEAIRKLAERDGETDFVAKLERIHEDGAETEKRCTELASSFDGKKTAILEEARSTKSKGAEMMKIYLDESSDALDGAEFLTMIEAGEVGHWSVLRELADGKPAVQELVAWAAPIQQRHFEAAMETSKKLAADEDPDEVSE